MLLAALLLAVAPGAAGDLNPTKAQKESLAVLVTAWADRLVGRAESLEKADVERALRKALYNKITYRAEAALEETLVELLAQDLGLRTSAGRREIERQLVPQWRQGAVADSGRVLDRKGFKHQHGAVLRHRRELLDDLAAVHDAHDVDDDGRKALETCAEYYADRMVSIVDEPGERKRMNKLLDEALVTRNTALAVQSVRGKVRGLLRRHAVAERKLKDDLEILALDAELHEQAAQAFPEVFWRELELDHQRCLERPAEHRKVLRGLLRGERRPDDATPPAPGSGSGQQGG
jgi:hypothetical protein